MTIIVVAMAMLVAVHAQSPPGLDRSTTSSIKSERDKDGNTVITTINREFKLMIEPCPLDAPKNYGYSLLLLEEFRSKETSAHEGRQGIVKVEAWAGKNVDALSRKWEFQQEGHSGTPLDCFYKITQYGCCMTPSTDVYYSLITGNKVFTSNHPLVGIVVPNTTIMLDRYFAYLAADNSFEDRQGAKPEDLVAVVQYGSETEILSRLAIHSKSAEHLLPPKISFLYEGKSISENTLRLWRVDGKKDRSSLSNFALVLAYDQAGDIIIPVYNDSPDIAKATISKQFWLEAVNSPSKRQLSSKVK